MLGEVAALSDARPRNLYLFGIFVADQPLVDCEARLAAPEPAAVPELVEAAGLPAEPSIDQQPATRSSIGILSAGTQAVSPPVVGVQSIATGLDAVAAKQVAASQLATVPCSTGAGPGAELLAQDEVGIMEQLIGLAEQPPHHIASVTASLAALQGSLKEGDAYALLEQTLLDNEKVWTLRPQVRPRSRR